MEEPSGNSLGPILFAVMINDLLVEYQGRWKYVDDSTLTETLIRDQASPLFWMVLISGVWKMICF